MFLVLLLMVLAILLMLLVLLLMLLALLLMLLVLLLMLLVLLLTFLVWHTSHALVIIIACPCDCCVDPMHLSSVQRVPAAKIWRKARMAHCGGRCTNMMGSSGMLRSEADVLLALTMQQC